MEIRPIPDFPGYHATTTGDIVGVKRGRTTVLKQHLDKDGYPRVGLYLQRTKKVVQRPVHILVALSFHGKPAEGQTLVRHRDGRRHNCRPENLIWGTPKENAADRYEHGTMRRPNAYLTEHDVIDIKLRLRRKESCMSISRLYGVNDSTIGHIKSGRTWSSVKVS